jgi:hypothetical protein
MVKPAVLIAMSTAKMDGVRSVVQLIGTKRFLLTD